MSSSSPAGAVALNPRNFGVKRLMREFAEFSSNPSDFFIASPTEDNLFEWHFTIRGPPDTEFEGGIYHGRILLPSNYPFKPPDIIMLTPSGRFQTNTKICLSISSFHPNNWQPSWSIRTVLTALIAFFPTPGSGAIGSLDYPPQERKVLASKSKHHHCSLCGKKNIELLPEISKEKLGVVPKLELPTTGTQLTRADSEINQNNSTSESSTTSSAPATPFLTRAHTDPLTAHPALSTPSPYSSQQHLEQQALMQDMTSLTPLGTPALHAVNATQTQSQFAEQKEPSSLTLPASATTTPQQTTNSSATANEGGLRARTTATPNQTNNNNNNNNNRTGVNTTPTPNVTVRVARSNSSSLSVLTVGISFCIILILLRKLYARVYATPHLHFV